MDSSSLPSLVRERLERHGASNCIVLAPRRVAASAETVFGLVCAVDRYGQMSEGHVTGHCALLGDGLPVQLGLHKCMGGLKGAFLGPSMAHSEETLVFQPEDFLLAWTRPVMGSSSDRWQLVEPVSDDECIYHSGIFIPSAIAVYLTGAEIRFAFEKLAEGIVKEASTKGSKPGPASTTE